MGLRRNNLKGWLAGHPEVGYVPVSATTRNRARQIGAMSTGLDYIESHAVRLTVADGLTYEGELSFDDERRLGVWRDCDNCGATASVIVWARYCADCEMSIEVTT